MGATKRGEPLIFPAPSPSSEPATLILLHGYANVPTNFAKETSLPSAIHGDPGLQHVKLIIPAGLPTKLGHLRTLVWYDVPLPGPQARKQPGSEPGTEADFNDIEENLDYLEELIREEVKMGTKLHRIALVGYSQSGGVVAYFALSRSLARQLGAIISVAGFAVTIPEKLAPILQKQKAKGRVTGTEPGTPMLLVHGSRDKFVSLPFFDAWKKDMELRRGQGLSTVEGQLVEMGHVWRPTAWEAINPWLEKRIPRTTLQTAKL